MSVFGNHVLAGAEWLNPLRLGELTCLFRGSIPSAGLDSQYYLKPAVPSSMTG